MVMPSIKGAGIDRPALPKPVDEEDRHERQLEGAEPAAATTAATAPSTGARCGCRRREVNGNHVRLAREVMAITAVGCSEVMRGRGQRRGRESGSPGAKRCFSQLAAIHPETD